MSFTIYQASAPVFARALTNLAAIFDKAAAHAEAKKIDQSVFMQARLAPDMFALPRQVQVASDTARRSMARLAGTEAPAMEDKEASFADLKARCLNSAEYVKSFLPAQIEGSEERAIAMKMGGKEISFTGRDYLFGFALPNFYFHVTTAYAILRHNGVEIGKMDFLGRE
ncbi:MAG: DUF1993 family protein [Reyranellaceae bacterium]